MAQAVISNFGERHEVIDSHLTSITPVKTRVPPRTPSHHRASRWRTLRRSPRSRSRIEAATTSRCTSALSSASRRTVDRLCRSVIPMSPSTRVRRTSRCRRRPWCATVCACQPNCSRSSARSHDGTARHVEAARQILATVGLDERSLGNPADLPLDRATAEEVLRTGGGRTPLQMNCSGKHGGMLVTSAINGWPVDASYLDREHPLQLQMTDDDRRTCRRAVQSHRRRRLRPHRRM